MQNDAITQLLQDWRSGDEDALEHLTPLVYEPLRKLASRLFQRENAGHTLQPTALVNELFQRLIGAEIDWHDRNHFYALSARMMRRILIDHATSKKAAKRGGDALRVTFVEGSIGSDSPAGVDVLAVNDALEELKAFDTRKAEILELHYFGGLTYTELADVMRLAESTVHQDLRTAKAWLHNRLAD